MILTRVLAWTACLSSGLALALLLLGIYGPGAIEDALHRGVVESVVWRPDSPPEVDARFRGLPDPNGLPDYFRVWAWNLTNLDDVRHRGAKPKMVEVGPLTYVKTRVKIDPMWDRRGRVTVKEVDTHVLRPELSGADPSAPLVTLNLPLLGVLELLHAVTDASPAMRPLLDVLVGVLSAWRDDHVDGLFMRRPMGELMWGYEDLLLQRLQALLGPDLVASTAVRLLHNDTGEEDVRANQVPCVIDTGWRPSGPDASATEPGPPGAAAGRRGGRGWRLGSAPADRFDEHRIWNIEVEQGWHEVTSWGPECPERVRGTDAFQFRPGLRRGEALRVWIAELFRSAALRYEEDTELHGVTLWRYKPDPREGEVDPCHYQTIRGLANVSIPSAVGPNGNASAPAAHGVPVLMSLPHFCLVDPSVTGALEGPACDPERHSTFIDVEPITGATLRAAKRLQMSSQLTDSARATLEPSIPTPLILPVFWVEEASQVSEPQAAAFRAKVYGVLGWSSFVRKWALPLAVASAAVGVAAAGAMAARLWAGGATPGPDGWVRLRPNRAAPRVPREAGDTGTLPGLIGGVDAATRAAESGQVGGAGVAGGVGGEEEGRPAEADGAEAQGSGGGLTVPLLGGGGGGDGAERGS
ncbi:hypothetical protein HYH03_015510 [Edaphochlamys debaryana]|uniref:Uncharacterized protein n=1 Tax=Edaphochlamys debaryana TaxID=47281 RepID=A0A836BSG6_9CHLO|nr:hypothetical protein HYH03_015510 [Edaphochlamys debaryana]|eukprot:KAG2485799.1 hypothetical protein HYH03_015510 [Edaphochlamys debaryana]